MRDPRKSPAAAAFLLGLDQSSLWISVLTFGELRRGLAIKRQRHGDTTALERWVNLMETNYADQTLGIDLPIAKLWGTVTYDRTRPGVDTLLAATALVHNLTLVTRNTKDFDGLPVKLLNPWPEV
jgi:predicted nucleic acid-binding protein